MASRAALITGGSGAIGLALARALGERGYEITLCANVPAEVDAAVAALRGEGIEAAGLVADVCAEDEVTRTIAEQHRLRGRLDVLVNNAGVAVLGPIEELDTEDIDRLIAVNLRAVVLGTREALPALRAAGAEHGEALIVNTASFAGVVGQPRLSIYAATKRGVIAFSRSTQQEVAGSGIRCTALAPSFVDTAMTDIVRETMPETRMIRPEDIGEAMRFLLRISPQCRIPEIVFTGPG